MEKEHRADIEVLAYAGGCRGSDQINYLLDVTVSGIHAITNVGKAGVPGGVANMAQIRKDKQYERFDHDGRIIAFAFDSEGGACDSVVKFINMIYAKPKGMSIWDTEGDRLSQKKTLIDTLSSVLAKHRARDKIFMGLKGKRSNESQVHQEDLGQIQDSDRIIRSSQDTEIWHQCRCQGVSCI